jgi:hypothetical protein
MVRGPGHWQMNRCLRNTGSSSHPDSFHRLQGRSVPLCVSESCGQRDTDSRQRTITARTMHIQSIPMCESAMQELSATITRQGTGKRDNYAYLVSDHRSNESFVLDPGHAVESVPPERGASFLTEKGPPCPQSVARERS